MSDERWQRNASQFHVLMFKKMEKSAENNILEFDTGLSFKYVTFKHYLNLYKTRFILQFAIKLSTNFVDDSPEFLWGKKVTNIYDMTAHNAKRERSKKRLSEKSWDKFFVSFYWKIWKEEQKVVQILKKQRKSFIVKVSISMFRKTEKHFFAAFSRLFCI